MRPPDQENICRVRAGRVVEVHIGRLGDVDALQSLATDVLAAIDRSPSLAVVCTDCRSACPVGREVAHAWSCAMRRVNRRIARSAFLLDPDNTMFNLQFERIVRCAINPERRCFTQVQSMIDWIGVALTEPERQALRPLFWDADATADTSCSIC